MDEASCGVPARQERGWKLIVLLPRLFLFKNAPGGTLGKEKFAKRFDMFVDGEWAELFRSSRKCAEDMASVKRRRQRRGHTDPDAKRLEKAMMLVQLGELSSRKALEGTELAPGTQTTLNALKDTCKRPPVPRDPLPRDISDFIPVDADFGQTDFGHPYWPTLAKSDFGQTDFGPKKLTDFGQAAEGWGPEGWGPEGWGPEGWEGPKFRSFSSLSHHRFALFVSLGVSCRGILVVFEALEPSNVNVWSSRAVVSPGGPEAAGFHTTTREPKRNESPKVRPDLQKHHQNSTRRPPRHEKTPRERKRMKFPAGEKKKSEILGGPAEGAVRRKDQHNTHHTLTATHTNTQHRR